LKLKIGTELYNITNNPTIKKSSREVTFNNIEIDFIGKSFSDRPVKWQEVSIVDELDKVLLFGYVSTISINEISTAETVLIMKLTIVSPRAFVSRKSFTGSGDNIELKTAVENVISPLFEDGFTIVQNDLPLKEINYTFVLKNIEKILNEMADKYNFYWFVDEQKNIYIKTLFSLQSQDAKVLDDGCFTLKPKLSAIDYANVVNFKNQIIFETRTLFSSIELTRGVTYQLPFPISVSKNTGSRIVLNNEIGITFLFSFTGVGVGAKFVSYDDSTKEIFFGSMIGIDGIDNKDILLVPDAFNKTLITGLKLADDYPTEKYTITDVKSTSALIPTSTIVTNPYEIEKQKGISSTSGRIEKTVDLKNEWFTKKDSVNFAKSILSENSVGTDEVEVIFRGLTDEIRTLFDNTIPFQKIELNYPQFLVEGSFIITDVDFEYGNEVSKMTIDCRNINFGENFIDIFRKDEFDIEEEVNRIIYSYAVIDDEIIEKKLTLVNGVFVDD